MTMKFTHSISIIAIAIWTLLALACNATALSSSKGEPTTADATVAPLPLGASALAPDFDPLASAAQRSPAVDDVAHDQTSHAQPTADESQPKAQQYTCPMHPEIVRNEPGNCPICGMKLVPKKPPQEKQ
jgi:hypothetical protein